MTFASAHARARSFGMRASPRVAAIHRAVTSDAMHRGDARRPARTVLGTMTFAWRYSSEDVNDDVATRMLDAFARRGHVVVDTALAYAGGETEKTLGRVMRGREDGLTVDTKANPWPGGRMTSSAGAGGLSASSLRAQVKTSLTSLNGSVRVRALYLHAPDAETTLEEILGEAERLRTEGAFEELGMSNYSASEVRRAHEICAERGWKPPSVYQGMYNALTRTVETELFPVLRELDVRFYAYNPLCGGLLTGKYAGQRDVNQVRGGRFDGNSMYQDRFWQPCFHDAVDDVVAACQKHGIAPADAALRWLYAESELDGSLGDAVIIGASSVAQLEANLDSADRASEPLPADVLDAFDRGWERCRPHAPPYFRGACKPSSS